MPSTYAKAQNRARGGVSFAWSAWEACQLDAQHRISCTKRGLFLILTVSRAAVGPSDSTGTGASNGKGKGKKVEQALSGNKGSAHPAQHLLFKE